MSFEEIMALPSGARFFKCALQVNTYDYQIRHSKPTIYENEASYNAAMVQSCMDNGIEVVGLADHYRIREAESLITAFKAAGIVVFPGFEAVSKEGVHFLVLFDPATSIDAVQGYIHACGVHGSGAESVPGDLDATDLLEAAAGWGAQVIAAHCVGSGGLLRVLSGKPRANVFTHPDLNACALPGPRSNAGMAYQAILDNKDPEYRRDRLMAIINAADANSPADFSSPSTTSFIRMDSPTAEGLRQAFLDHESRIRLNSDDALPRHTEVVGMEVESEGFLKNLKVRFGEGLNVLIGGRGAGKSALIECLRYALDVRPLGEDAGKAHDSIVRKVLKSRTRITVYVQTYSPDERWYRVERVISQEPKVFDQDGIEVAIPVAQLLGGVSVYGQSELAELARDHSKMTELLGRFVEPDEELDSEVESIFGRLSSSRERIVSIDKEVNELREKLAPLPGIVDTLARYKSLGVEERLSEQASVVKSDGLISLALARLQPFDDLLKQIRAQLPIPKGEFEGGTIEGLAASDALGEIHAAFLIAENKIKLAMDEVDAALAVARAAIGTSRGNVEVAKADAAGRYEEALRELQKESVDGAEFIRLREAVSKLEPLQGAIDRLEAEAAALRVKRSEDIARWRTCKSKQLDGLEGTAKRVTKELEGLRVSVVRGQDRRELSALIRTLPGRLAEATTVLETVQDLDVVAFADSCRAGAEALASMYRLTAMQAQRLCEAGEAFFMGLEQVDLKPITMIEFNIAPPKSPAIWKALGDLSVGQKATALLYLLMLDSDGPLILDQPEDNLDNRFVSEGIVPKIREEKRKRQLIFATHNANIPVLGDAEQIIAIDAEGEADGGKIRIDPGHTGAIDSPKISSDIKEILEGGPGAFKTRRLKYGF